jgi:hypothetical protein
MSTKMSVALILCLLIPSWVKPLQLPKLEGKESNLYRWKVLEEGAQGDSASQTNRIPSETWLEFVPRKEKGQEKLLLILRTTLMNGDLNEIEATLQPPFIITSYRNTVRDLKGNVLKETTLYHPEDLREAEKQVLPAPLLPIALRATRFIKYSSDTLKVSFGELEFNVRATPVQRKTLRTPLGKFRCFRVTLDWESTDFIPSPFFFRWLNESLLPVMEFYFTTDPPHRWISYEGPYPGPAGPRLYGWLHSEQPQ